MPKEGFWTKDGNFHLGRLFLVLFLIEISMFVGISSLNLSNPQLLEQFKNQQNSILSKSYLGIFMAIFPNNLRIASLEFIPIYGALVFFESTYLTALVIAIEGGPGIPGIVVFISLALVPHTWLELPAYAVSVAGGIYLLYLLIKRKQTLRRNIIKVLYLYIFVVVELAIAAVFETTEIYFQMTLSSYLAVLYSLLLWIPAACIIVAMVWAFRKIRRIPRPQPILEETPQDAWNF